MKVTCEQLLESARTDGFVSLPISFFKEDFFCDEPCSKREALALMVSTVNFKDKHIRFGDKWMVCKRGESICSIFTWRSRFRWTSEQVRSFFDELYHLGYLIPPGNPIHSDHIRMAHYDRFTGREALVAGARLSCGRDEGVPPDAPVRPYVTPDKDPIFEKFWLWYHEITGIAPSERSRARRAWDGLSLSDQDVAIDGVQIYYMGLTDKRFCRKAATYLETRAFD